MNDTILFSPSHSVGTHFPPGIVYISPLGLFQLLFSNTVIDSICRCSSEYSEIMKNKRPGMYKYYNGMTREDFLKLVGVIIHLGY